MTETRPTVVVGAAPSRDGESFYRALLADAGLVVAADGAAEWCAQMGRVPDIAVGDFDSARPGAEERLSALGVEVRTFPAAKDRTDLELAVDIARQGDCAPIVLTAAFSERLDHTLAALGVLLRAGSGARVCEPSWTGFVVCPSTPLAVETVPGAQFSVVAIGHASGVDVADARWPLRRAALDPLSGHGVSNVTSGEILRVSVREGTLIVIVHTASGLNDTL